MWLSDDAGATWQPVAGELPHSAIMAVAVSPLEEVGGIGVVWAGTEPSAMFRSEDGGRTWQERAGLQALPSKPTWSFPPRPWTHHVRWIEPDATVADRLFVGIELGGVMRSLDGGQTWEDRKPGSQHDCHTLRTHKLAPGVIYEAVGGGFAESRDGRVTWRGYDEGRRHHYLWGLAVDPADPDTLVVSGSPGPRSAHSDQSAEARLYRRTNGGPGNQSVQVYLIQRARGPMCWRPTRPSRGSFMPPPGATCTVLRTQDRAGKSWPSPGQPKPVSIQLTRWWLERLSEKVGSNASAGSLAPRLPRAIALRQGLVTSLD